MNYPQYTATRKTLACLQAVCASVLAFCVFSADDCTSVGTARSLDIRTKSRMFEGHVLAKLLCNMVEKDEKFTSKSKINLTRLTSCHSRIDHYVQRTSEHTNPLWSSLNLKTRGRDGYELKTASSCSPILSTNLLIW